MEQPFDALRRDRAPARVLVDVLLAVDVFEESSGIAFDDIARLEPPVPKGGRGFLLVRVAAADIGAPEQELPVPIQG